MVHCEMQYVVNTPTPSTLHYKQDHYSQVYIRTYTEEKIGGTGREGRRR
jgi:hypothetical protein